MPANTDPKVVIEFCHRAVNEFCARAPRRVEYVMVTVVAQDPPAPGTEGHHITISSNLEDTLTVKLLTDAAQKLSDQMARARANPQ